MQDILNLFSIDGTPVMCQPYGNGHINRTFLVDTDTKHKYILQRINNCVFHDVHGLMSNISSVTRHLHRSGLDSRHALTLVPTMDGCEYIHFISSDDTITGYYRIYEYVTNSICISYPQSPRDFYQSALAFGRFQMLLKDFPADTLIETIPKFHDTVNRFSNLHRAINVDKLQRAKRIRKEIDFALDQERYAGFMLDMLTRGDLPLRVTHNDTKLNNVMLDATTRNSLCVIDLDTVMPGLSCNDFGDSIRFGANTSTEDEPDLRKVEMDLELFRACASGFLMACGKALTKNEIETLPMAAKLMTLECGIRFLTDYLEGDDYFRIHHPEHNLDRARTQFKLVSDMNKKWDIMHQIVHDEAGR